LTSSGYPRVAKLWRRGTPLASATTVAEGKVSDVFVQASRDQTLGFERDFVYRGVTFYTNELFLMRDGRLVVNELAPRVHNSGHWTIEGAVTSQFEQHIRAICGLGLGSTAALAPTALVNLLGTGRARPARLEPDAVGPGTLKAGPVQTSGARP
jgi:phosphoribosylaminoimidazole carboxylase (NCAIR synthetase)